VKFHQPADSACTGDAETGKRTILFIYEHEPWDMFAVDKSLLLNMGSFEEKSRLQDNPSSDYRNVAYTAISAAKLLARVAFSPLAE
jgi:hypothetical protein